MRFQQVIFSTLFLIGLVWPQRILAQADIKFDHLSDEHGLSQNSAMCFLHDSRGLMWIGAESGLNRYDGYQIKVYKSKANDANSLSNDQIRALYEDRDGIIWIGTNGGGLNRFDRVTETFKTYIHDPKQPGSLSHNYIRTICREAFGGIWLGTYGGGLNYFSPQTGLFKVFKHDPADAGSLCNDYIRDMAPDSSGRIWLATKNGLSCFDPKTGAFKNYVRDPNNPNSLQSDELSKVYVDQHDQIWIATRNSGISVLTPQTDTFKLVQPQAVALRSATGFFQDAAGFVWMSTWQNGLVRYDPAAERLTNYVHAPQNIHSLGSDYIYTVYADHAGFIWLGTANGADRFQPKGRRFRHYHSEPGNVNSLSHNDVTCILEDSAEQLWIGTFGGGLAQFNHENDTFTYFVKDPANPFSISSNDIKTICKDSRGALWIGAWGSPGGLNLLDRQTGKFTQYLPNAADSLSLSGNLVSCIYEDRQGTLWIGTWEGLNRYDPVRNCFIRYKNTSVDGASDVALNRIETIYEDSSGLWIGSYAGLAAFDRKNGKFTNYQHSLTDSTSLSHNTVYCLREDRMGRLWVGTGGGLNRLDRRTMTFTAYDETHGLPNNSISAILEDDAGNLWLSTLHGLAKLDLATESFKIYDVRDGLQGNEFERNSACRTTKGEMFFGGLKGFTTFFPDQIQDNPYVPPVIITDFQIFNRPVAVKSDGSTPLSRAITETDRIVLSYRQSVFSFGFAAMNFEIPEKNRYAYKMEGFDADWTQTDASRRFATYTNLDPGDYTFRVKGCNNDGVWNETGASLKIIITPPWWKTWWAYSSYALLLIGAIIGFVRFQQKKVERKQQEIERKQKELEREQAIAEQLRRVDKLKDEFLANTSHELRTPLNGIIGLAESLLDGVAGILPDKAHFDLKMISASGRRLSNLVNDILDFSKMIDNRIELSLKPVNLHAIVEFVLALSQPSLGKKNLTLINAVNPDLPTIMADENRLQQIIQNLVGNAIKFTESGTVAVSIQEMTFLGEMSFLPITVSDTGIGIAADKLEEIFKSFVQADGSVAREYGGTGLGLAITKNLVELHGGTISVKSKLGEGSQFTVMLPSVVSDQSSAFSNQSSAFSNQSSDFSNQSSDFSNQSSAVSGPLSAIGIQQPTVEPKFDRLEAKPENRGLETKNRLLTAESLTILVVDDEPVNQHVLGNFLTLKNYKIVQAMNGLEALKLVEEGLKPDLILLDVMMPKMSGYEVCRKVREKYPHHDVPVILLTAKNQEGDIQEGFDAGANDYVTKPFHRSELLSRIQTHIHVSQTAEIEAENRRRNHEMGRARAIQASMLPLAVPDIAQLEIAAFIQPAGSVGGDYYDFIPSPDGKRVYIVIADVSGKGLPASLLTIEARSMLHTLVEDNPSPLELLSRINRQIYKDVQKMTEPMMITMLLLMWDSADEQLYYTGAGHDPFLVRRPAGQCEVIYAHGIWLGVTDKLDDMITIKPLLLQPGDLVVLYTDGVTEYHNREKEMFGLERLVTFLEENPITQPDDTITRLMTELERFGEGAPQHDDITVVALKRQ